jgi:hypothetical protein
MSEQTKLEPLVSNSDLPSEGEKRQALVGEQRRALDDLYSAAY